MSTLFVQVSYMRSQKSYKNNVMFIVSKLILLQIRYARNECLKFANSKRFVLHFNLHENYPSCKNINKKARWLHAELCFSLYCQISGAFVAVPKRYN